MHGIVYIWVGKQTHAPMLSWGRERARREQAAGCDMVVPRLERLLSSRCRVPLCCMHPVQHNYDTSLRVDTFIQGTCMRSVTAIGNTCKRGVCASWEPTGAQSRCTLCVPAASANRAEPGRLCICAGDASPDRQARTDKQGHCNEMGTDLSSQPVVAFRAGRQASGTTYQAPTIPLTTGTYDHEKPMTQRILQALRTPLSQGWYYEMGKKYKNEMEKKL